MAAVGGQAVLDEQSPYMRITSAAHRLDLGGHEVLSSRTLPDSASGKSSRRSSCACRSGRSGGDGGRSPHSSGLVLIVAAAEGVGSDHDLVADGQLGCRARHAGHHKVVAEVRRADGLVHCSGSGGRRRRRDYIEDLHRVLRSRSLPLATVSEGRRPHMPRISESTPRLLRGGGLSGRDDGVVAAADDDALQRIPVVQASGLILPYSSVSFETSCAHFLQFTRKFSDFPEKIIVILSTMDIYHLSLLRLIRKRTIAFLAVAQAFYRRKVFDFPEKSSILSTGYLSSFAIAQYLLVHPVTRAHLFRVFERWAKAPRAVN